MLVWSLRHFLASQLLLTWQELLKCVFLNATRNTMKHSRTDLMIQFSQSIRYYRQKIHFSPIQPIAAPPNQPSSSSLPQSTLILRNEKRTLQDLDTSDSEYFWVRRSKSQVKNQRKETNHQTQTRIQDIQHTYGYLTGMPESGPKFIGTVLPRNPNELWMVDPNRNIPREKEMTALETELLQSDNSD